MARAKRFKQNDNTNAIAYYRFSSDAQREVSIDQQRDEAIAYCKEHGYHLIKEYEDRAVSGSRFDRAGLQLMLSEVEKLRPGYLILWKTDRLSRDRIDAAIAKHKLREAGVKIEYVAEALPEDEATRVLMESIEEGLAEHFLIQHSKNVTRGMKYNAENALYNGHKIFGYTGVPNEKYKIDPATAPLVQRIFKDYTDGKPMKVIADWLNSVGARTVRGKEFTEKTLWHTLHNRSYIGEYRFGDIVVPGGFPALITEEMFDKAQSMMALNKHGGRGAGKKLDLNNGPYFWLSGHLRCGECGEMMTGTAGTSRNGSYYYYYRCNNHKKKCCKKSNVPQDTLEKIIGYILEECINDASLRLLIANRVYDYYCRENSGDEAYEKVLLSEKKDIEKKLSNIMKAIEDGIYNDTTKQRMDELHERLSIVKDEIAVEQNRKKYALKKEHIIRYLESFVGSMKDSEHRAKILDCLVDTIYVYDDKLVINFYYSDDKREVGIQEFLELINGREELLNVFAHKYDSNSVNTNLEAFYEEIVAEFNDTDDDGGTGENF